MIYLDRVVEDVELEVATIYAEKLGLRAPIVSDLFATIATSDPAKSEGRDVRKEVLEFLNLHKDII